MLTDSAILTSQVSFGIGAMFIPGLSIRAICVEGNLPLVEASSHKSPCCISKDDKQSSRKDPCVVQSSTHTDIGELR